MHDEFIFCFGFSLILGRGRMDGISKLGARFHFRGEFIAVGEKLQYVGGSEAMSYIDRDLVSLPEIVGLYHRR